jgi:hypothetical protein
MGDMSSIKQMKKRTTAVEPAIDYFEQSTMTLKEWTLLPSFKEQIDTLALEHGLFYQEVFGDDHIAISRYLGDDPGIADNIGAKIRSNKKKASILH